MLVVFTDLHGTLLDLTTNDWSAARPAVMMLHQKNIPLAMVSSKTRAEIELWRDQMAVRHPFIVENGAATFIGSGYFGAPVPGAIHRGGYEVLVPGSHAADLHKVLRGAAREAAVLVRTLDQMTDAEIQRHTALRPEQVPLVRRREFGIPFLLENDEDGPKMRRAIEVRGFRYTQGGRFHHIHGDYDKRRAVKTLLGLYREHFEDVIAIGLGDGRNDTGFLAEMNTAVVMQGPNAVAMCETLPRAIITDKRGPAGWNETVTRVVLERAARA
jgi:mannosyl-3-phosphoglycerate phosphatase